MDFLTRKLRDFRGVFVKEQKIERKREITRFEGYFELCYKILSWEDASITLTVFLVLNFVFWLVIQLQLKFFGVIFLLTLVGFVADAVFENTQYFAGEALHVDFLDDVKNDLGEVIASLKALRKENPSWFCIGMSIIFLFLSFVARNMSGHVLFYLVLLGIFFIPLVVAKLIPPEHLASARHFIKSLGSEKGVLAEDELIPFISDKDFNQRDPDLDSLLTDKTADSVNNSLTSGLHSMPSHLDEDKESLEEEDLLPGTSKGRISGTPGEISSDSDSENKMRFESGHFNGDSSSEEEQYAKNLTFAEDHRDSAERDIVGMISVAAVGDNLIRMATAIRNVVTNQPTRKDSSSDSEFEIINSEDADEH